MKKFAKTFLLVLATLMWSGTMQAQWPMEDGFAVMTCFSGYVGNNPSNGVADDFVMGVYDVRDYANNTPNQNWNAPMFHDNSWTSGNLGQVFGVAIDETNGDIFVTATTCYPHNDFTDPLSFGPGGAGGIYRIDGTSGAITNLPSLFNTGSGLGNITYDKENDQLFVTNHEDGLIYRLNKNGVVLSSWDFPGSVTFAGSGGSGFVELGERLWGVAVNDGRVYFGVWNEDRGAGRHSANVSNEIWSIELVSGDFHPTALPVLEVSMPDYETENWSMPVSDIAFDCHGYMLVGERGMSNNINPVAHRSRVLEFEHNGIAWTQKNQYKFGYNNGTSIIGDNSAGGVDYGFGGFDPKTGEMPYCDSVRWVTGDFFSVNGQTLYGGGGMEEPSSDVWYVDADGIFGSNVKRFIGDIEIMGLCTCCDSTCDTCDLDFDISYCCQSEGIGGDPAKCDLCDTTENPNGNFWVWVEDDNGNILWSPPYIFEWTDENGNVLSTAPALLAQVNTMYCVKVIDPSTPDSCEWEYCFEHLCCDSIEIDIEGCFGDSIASRTFTQEFKDEVAKFERKMNKSGLLDTTSCNPCDNPNDEFLIWVVDGDGNILNDPPYTFEWKDENGNIISTFPVALASINTWYYVKVTDSIGCMFVDSFYYECCEELEIEITSCYDFQGVSGRTSSLVSASMESAMQAYKTKSLTTATLPTEGCDPCETPTEPFFVWVTDGVGNELNDPPYSFTWKDENGNIISTFPFAVIYVNQKYYVCVEDTLGCIHVDSIHVECCEATTPTNLGCFTFGTQTFLTWDPVPGAASYDLIITPYTGPNDRCCRTIPPNPQSWIFSVTDNNFNVALSPYQCFSWRVRSVCPDGSTSPYSNWECFDGRCPIIGRWGQEPSSSANIISMTSTPIELMKAFPNPTTGRLQLSGPAIQAGFQVDIYDQLSRKVGTTRFTEDLISSIDMSANQNGIYFLQLKDEAGRTIYTSKVILMK